MKSVCCITVKPASPSMPPGMSGRRPKFTSPRFVEPRKIVLVDGILLYVEPELRKLFDVKIYVDTDADIRLIRRIRRDIAERGRTLDSVVAQ